MRILVTNDDGIHAPGLEALERIAHTLSDDVWVISPEVEQSGTGHSLSLTMPIRFRKVNDRKFAVYGTPTDCVLTAIEAIMPKDKKIDLVLSGVNRGANIAEDITHSGTVAAAMEATLCHIPAIAMSQYFQFWEPDAVVRWETAMHFAPGLIKQLVAQKLPKGSFINMNFPDLPVEEIKGVKVVPHGWRDTYKKLTPASDPKGRKYYWINWADEGVDPIREDCDMKWLLNGYITITPIHMDLTDYKSLDKLSSAIKL